MKNRRSVLLAITAATVAAPIALGVNAPAQAVTVHVTKTSCSQKNNSTCYFPNFKPTSIPEVIPGKEVTITGVGAVDKDLGNTPVRILGGFNTVNHNDVKSLSVVEGEIKPDGTWSVTVTAPSKAEAANHEEIRLIVSVRALKADGFGYGQAHTYEGVVDFPSNKGKPGWFWRDDLWYWRDAQGVRVKGWNKIEGHWYYFNTKTSVMETGWLKNGANWYYLKPNGKMATGWQKIGSNWYYLKPDGAMAKGWQKVGVSWYYLNGDGSMVTGWVKIGANWYYLQADGVMATGWQKVGGSWYYLRADGVMVTGWHSIDGRWSLFAPSGAWRHYG